jgi:HD-like signal output (HDOD) protein
LHDIGKIVVHANSPHESTEVTEVIRRCEVPSVIAEAQQFRATYADIGAYLLVLWGIDPEVAAIVQYHERLDSFMVNDVPALAAVHVAHSMNAADPIGHPLQLEYLAALGFADADRWPLEAALATL